MIRGTLALLSFCTLAFGRTALLDNPSWRVVGGQEAVSGQFPYIISLRTIYGHNCGGSIIDKQWIITAGHCVEYRKPEDFFIVAGITKLDEEGVTYLAEKIIQHENYNGSQLTDDIAVIKLKTPVEESDVLKIISLNNEINDPINVTLSGWGRTSYPGNSPNELQFLDLKTVPWEECDQKLAITGVHVHEKQICTFTQEGQGACYGDSGGPLVKYNDDKVATLVGLVSWGQPCAKGYPDVFTRVSSYVDWINNAITNN